MLALRMALWSSGSKRMGKYRKVKITADVLKRLAPGETIMDIDQPGYGARRQKDAVTLFVRKFANGRRHFQTIGQYGQAGLTATTGRQHAARIIMAIRDGQSPAESREREKAMPTVSQLATQWLEVHVDTYLKPSTRRNYRDVLRNTILPVVGDLRVDNVTNSDVARLHARKSGAPFAANRGLAVLSKLMEFAEREGYRPQQSNPVKGLKRYRESKRERYLSVAELQLLGAALSHTEERERHTPQAIAAIGLLLLTGMRCGEALSLRWSEVDLERGLLLLSDSKTGRKPIVLGKPAIELLAAQPREGEFVFPSPVKANAPIGSVTKAWRTVRRLAGLEDLRLHDLRHTFASIAASSGGSLPMVGRLLGHSQAQTTARYAHLAHDPVRSLADETATKIMTAITSADDANRQKLPR